MGFETFNLTSMQFFSTKGKTHKHIVISKDPQRRMLSPQGHSTTSNEARDKGKKRLYCVRNIPHAYITCIYTQKIYHQNTVKILLLNVGISFFF